MDPTTLPRTASEPARPALGRTLGPETFSRGPGLVARRAWRGPTEDPTWARPALIALLVATGAFYLYNLSASGWANSFYSAAAQAGSANWEAFFFGSSDAANSITVDKPPASLWVMALSVRVFGLSSFALLAPQVLMGVAGVGVLYATVKKSFGVPAGLVAGAVLALTPVAVLMFRFNNPDALLTLLMVVAAWATMKAVDKTSPRWFMLVGVLIGLAFLTKTLQAFLVVPGYALAYLVAAKTTLPKRIAHVLLGGLALVLSAGWWVAVVELLPQSMRPYIGGSQTNSFLELTFGYNGFGRITGEETGSVGGGGNWGSTGLGRLFNTEIGGQISWLIPAALALLAVGLYLRGRRPRTDTRRAAYLVWGAWLLVTALTFSLMAGIFHAYYTVALAPAVAAVVGMGAAEAWEHRNHPVGPIALAVATAATAVWGFVLLSRSVEWNGWLRVVVLAVGLAAAFGFLVVSRIDRRAVPVVVGAALVAALVGPAAYAVQTVATAHTGSIVSAGPTIAGGAAGPGGGMRGGQAPGGARGGAAGGLLNASTPSTAVVSVLSANADAYTWVAATIGSQNAAGLQLGTQLPVMAIGGFNGSDPSPTLEQFQGYVQSGQIHYFLSGGGGLGGNANGGSNVGSQISTWVQESFTAVTIGGSTFYDLTQPCRARPRP